MGSALWAGISGLNASAKQLDVIANNLANVNTIGFKGDSVFFSDVLSSSISGGSSGTLQVGRGVAVSDVQTQFGSGSFETTGNATDAAIDGDGFFMVNDAEGATYYTRAGAFHLDSDGVLVDINGYTLQGQTFDPLTGTLSALGDINLQGLQSAPATTTTTALGANLNSQTLVGGTYTTTQTVYDSLGANHTLQTVFTKTAENVWGATATLDSVALTLSTTSFTFDSDGNMVGPADVSVTVPALPSGATIGVGNVITWNLAGDDSLDLTQYASASVIRATAADGYASGQLKSLSIDQDGIISGFFTNGQTAELAQIILASFPNPWALNKLGSNLFGETVMSGSSVRNNPGDSGMGSLTPNTLEMSNTDIATEFIRMITAQKAYQANAKVVTTQDAIMQVLMNLKQ